MKKLLLSLTLCFVALVSMAQNLSYNEDINVTLQQEQNGEMTEAPLPTAPGKIEVSKNDDGTCDFLLRNFSLSMGEESAIYVGNISLKGVKMTEGADGKTAIETKQTITLENGDEIEGVTWLGPLLGPVPIDLKGSMDDKNMYAVIDIDLKATMNMAVHVTIGKKVQVYNEDIAVKLKQMQEGEMVEAPLGVTPGKIEVSKNNDGTCDFLLPNFILASPDGDLPVGNIRLKGVKMTEGTDGKTAIETKQTITLENGDAIDGIFWLGPMLGAVPIDLKGYITEKSMFAEINIDLQENMNILVNVVIGKNAETGITEVTAVGVKHTGVYNLNGIRVAEELSNSLPAGVYIVNGKKTIVK